MEMRDGNGRAGGCCEVNVDACTRAVVHPWLQWLRVGLECGLES